MTFVQKCSDDCGSYVISIILYFVLLLDSIPKPKL